MRDILDVPQIPENIAVAVFVALVCGVSAFGANAWQARYPLPVSYARPNPAKADALTEPYRPFIRPTEKYVRLDPPVEKTKLRSTAGLPWTCEEVRQATQGMTPRQIERLARLHRLNHEQRAEAARCLKEKRS